MRFQEITMSFGLAAAVAIATPAPAANGPLKANEYTSWFVKAYVPCTNPTTTHNPPFGLIQACTPTVNPGSTMSFGPGGACKTTAVVLLNSLTKKASDVRLRTVCHDILDASQCSPINPFCGADGVYTLAATIRITDNNCVAAGPCTMDIPFPMPLYCGSTAARSPSVCFTATTINTIVPGMVVGDKDANVEFSQLQIWRGIVVEFVEGLRLP